MKMYPNRLNVLLGSLVITGLLITFSFGKSRQEVLEDKVNQMVQWSNARPVIRLNGDKFRQYVKGSPRNYSVILMLTALAPHRGCQICKKSHEEYTILANSYRYGSSYTNSLFFTMVDFDDAPDVFKALNQQTAPVFVHFPAKGSPKTVDNMDLQRLGFFADAIGRFVAERTGVHIQIFRPPDYSSAFALCLLALTVAGVIYIKRDSLEYVYNTTFWSVLVMAIIFAMLSGQMWNQIRGPPFVHRNPNTGETHFFNGHSQGQFVAETYIVYLLYAAASIGMIMLNEASLLKEEKDKRKFVSLIGVAVFAFFFSMILSVFRAKNQGYPYSFLLS